MCSPKVSTVHAVINIAGEVLSNLINTDKKIKEIQMGDHDSDFETIWKWKDKLPHKINFSKSQTLWAGTYKNRIDQPRQLKYSKFSLKYLKLILLTLF